MLREKRVDVRGMIASLIMIITSLVFLSGCTTYNDKISPYIPSIGIGLNIGGEGIGIEASFTSEWEEGERKRYIELSPDVDIENLNEESLKNLKELEKIMDAEVKGLEEELNRRLEE